MRYTVTKSSPLIYSNADQTSKFVPLNSYVFNIPVKKGKLNSIGLFLNATGGVQGKLTVDLYIDKAHRRYNLTPDQIVSGSPIDLVVDHIFLVESMLHVCLKFTQEGSEGSFEIKVTNNGPCLYLEGENVAVHEFKYPPLISIITPVYKTDLGYLKATVQSVIKQSYDKWELCIVDDGSGDEVLKTYLESIQDDKIKVLIKEDNSGIVEATNEAIKMASGMFVGFLDHDDLLDEDALLYVALEIEKDPATDLVYTDEDKVLEDGRFVGPFYKPDFNYNLLLSSMYTCHFSVYRRTIIRELGGVRDGFDGSQDYDLVLRFIEKTKNIKHVPKILYHWRITDTSTSKSIVNKPNARIHGARALREHLKREGIPSVVAAGNFPGHYDVRYILPYKPKISVIIPFKDEVYVLNNLLKTLEMTHYPDFVLRLPNYEIILIDNNSEEEETQEYLSKLSSNKLYKVYKYKKEFNFSSINNFAVSKCSKDSELVLFLNSDIEIMHPEWLYYMAQHFIRPKVAAVGAKLLYLDHRIQHAGVIVGVNGVAGHSHKMLFDWNPGYFSRPHLTQDITAVTGACMMVRKDDFLTVEGFDPNLPTAFGDVDLCLKLRKRGSTIVYTPFARLYHRESYTRGLDSIEDEKFLSAISYITEKWDLTNFKDPFYNPNLPDNCEGHAWV